MRNTIEAFHDAIINRIKKFFSKDIINTLINFGWRLLSGPLTMILIPLFTDSVTQGYWYTFVSLAALSVFADLGFTTIVSQFAAHEFAFLEIGNSGLIMGDKDHLGKLSSLFKFVTKWSLGAYILSFPIILFIGFLVLSDQNQKTNWLLPWVFYILLSGLNFILSSVYSFFEGCDQISKVQRVKFLSSIIQTIFLWTTLYMRLGLWALSLSAIVGILVNAIYLNQYFKVEIMQLHEESKNYTYSWRTEFLNLIWKYAISWSSGYFIMQLFTPLVFHFKSAVDAGKVGISISLISALFSISNVFIYTLTPKLNMRASKRDWEEMDRLIVRSTTISSITYIIGSFFLLIIFGFYGEKIPLLNRFVEFKSLVILVVAWFFQLVINSLAVYLRAHKKEPYMNLSVLVALYVGLTTYLIARYFPIYLVFLGFLTSYVFALPIAIYIYIKRRKEWHAT